MTEEERRAIVRNNYSAQMEMLGYQTDGNPKDMVEVVRCKDCKHRHTYPQAYGAEINGKWCYWCELNRSWRHDDYFCADGERR